MYLIHSTTTSHLKLILHYGELTVKINEGDGIYKTNNYVYFYTTENLFDTTACGHVLLYLKPNF